MRLMRCKVPQIELERLKASEDIEGGPERMIQLLLVQKRKHWITSDQLADSRIVNGFLLYLCGDHFPPLPLLKCPQHLSLNQHTLCTLSNKYHSPHREYSDCISTLCSQSHSPQQAPDPRQPRYTAPQQRSALSPVCH